MVIGKVSGRKRYGLLDVTSWKFYGSTGGHSEKSSVRVAGAPTVARTYTLPNTRQNIFVFTSGSEYEKKERRPNFLN